MPQCHSHSKQSPGGLSHQKLIHHIHWYLFLIGKKNTQRTVHFYEVPRMSLPTAMNQNHRNDAAGETLKT